jgi:hypothetical protein
MGRQSPRGHQSRRAFFLAPLTVAGAVGVALFFRSLGGSTGAAVDGGSAALLPARAPSPRDLTWSPGSRLATSLEATPRVLPVGAGGPETVLRVVAPEGGTDRSAWLERLLAAGLGPDVITGLLSCEVRRIAVASRVTDLVRRDRLQVEQFDAGAYRALEAGGDLWGLPYAWTGAEIGIALNRGKFPRAGVPGSSSTVPTDVERQANGWSWAEFAEAMAVAASDGRTSGSIALERFGTIRSLPATWRARWSDERGRVALDDRDSMIEALRRFDSLRREIGATARRPDPTPSAAVRRGAPTPVPVPTPGIMRGPASVALGVGGPGLMRTGRAAAASIEIEQAPEYASSLLMPLPRGAASVADVEPMLSTITGRADRRDAAWRLMRWLVEDGRLARAERLVPAWRAAQAEVVAEIARNSPPIDVRPNPIAALFTFPDTASSHPREGDARTVSPTQTTRKTAAVEFLILAAVRRAAPQDPVLDGPAGIEARRAIGVGLQAWEAGEVTAAEALDTLGPTLQAILDRTPSVLPD